MELSKLTPRVTDEGVVLESDAKPKGQAVVVPLEDIISTFPDEFETDK